MGASKAGELVWNPATAAATTWYLLEDPGDSIAFVSYEEGEWPFRDGSADDVSQFREVSERVIEALLQSGHLEDHGIVWADEDDPFTYYVRDLRSTWSGWGTGGTQRDV